MKKSFTVFLGLFLACSILTGCRSSSYSTDKQAILLLPAGTTENAFKPTYEIGKKPVYATVVKSYFSLWGDVINDENVLLSLKKAAVAQACLQSGCDKLAGATFQFQCDTWLFFSDITCIVKGYPATVVSVEEVPIQSTPIMPPPLKDKSIFSFGK